MPWCPESSTAMSRQAQQKRSSWVFKQDIVDEFVFTLLLHDHVSLLGKSHQREGVKALDLEVCLDSCLQGNLASCWDHNRLSGKHKWWMVGSISSPGSIILLGDQGSSSRGPQQAHSKSRKASLWLGGAVLWSIAHWWIPQIFFPYFSCFFVDFLWITFYPRDIEITKELFILLSEKYIFPWASNSVAEERERFGEELQDTVLSKGTDLELEKH